MFYPLLGGVHSLGGMLAHSQHAIWEVELRIIGSEMRNGWFQFGLPRLQEKLLQAEHAAMEAAAERDAAVAQAHSAQAAHQKQSSEASNCTGGQKLGEAAEGNAGGAVPPGRQDVQQLQVRRLPGAKCH